MKLADMFGGRSLLVVKEVEIDETVERVCEIILRNHVAQAATGKGEL